MSKIWTCKNCGDDAVPDDEVILTSKEEGLCPTCWESFQDELPGSGLLTPSQRRDWIRRERSSRRRAERLQKGGADYSGNGIFRALARRLGRRV